MDRSRTDPGGARHAAPAYRHGHHWVSPHNFEAAETEGFAFPHPLTIFDSTLRKMLYVTGTRPSIDDMLRVAEALGEAGIREVFLNVQWWGDDAPEKMEYDVCRAVLARDFGFHTTVSTDWFSLSRRDAAGRDPVPPRKAIETVRAVGATTISVTLHAPEDPAEEAHQLARLGEAYSHARSLGMDYVVSLNDVGRMNFEAAVRLANAGIRLGAARVDLSDSYSSLSPEGMRLFITRFRGRLAAPVPVTVHVHNDFGLGTAAALAATTAGAHPDVAVNGISYRAGFAALEEVAVSLETLYGVGTGLRLERLRRLSDLVAERLGLPRSPLKPVSGAHAFLLDFPSWVGAYLRRGPDAFPPTASCYAPSLVAARTQVVWGHHHSDAVIRAKLDQMGLSATEQQVREIRRRIEAEVEALESYPRWLGEEQVEAICRTVVA